MRGRILTLATITLILISTQGTVANPGGEGDETETLFVVDLVTEILL